MPRGGREPREALGTAGAHEAEGARPREDADGAGHAPRHGELFAGRERVPRAVEDDDRSPART